VRVQPMWRQAPILADNISRNLPVRRHPAKPGTVRSG
jgi:hypothetical protein